MHRIWERLKILDLGASTCTLMQELPLFSMSLRAMGKYQGFLERDLASWNLTVSCAVQRSAVFRNAVLRHEATKAGSRQL